VTIAVAARLILSASRTGGKPACKAWRAAPDPTRPDRTPQPDSDPSRHCAGLHGWWLTETVPSGVRSTAMSSACWAIFA